MKARTPREAGENHIMRFSRNEMLTIIAATTSDCTCDDHSEANRIATRLQAVLDAQGRPKSRAEREATEFVEGFARAVSGPL